MNIFEGGMSHWQQIIRFGSFGADPYPRILS